MQKLAIGQPPGQCERYAFHDCRSLESITIPHNVTEIDDYAFSACGSLTDVYYEGTEAQWNAIAIGAGNDPLVGASVHYNHVHDYTGDGQISDADAIYLLRYTLFPDGYPITGNGDVNNDGGVTDADAIYLLRYTLFPEDYPLFSKK